MSKKSIAFIFPGQGVQSVGMGKDFYDHFASARALFQQGDDLLGRFLSKIIFEGPSNLLLKTCNSQTAIYLTSMAILQVLLEQFPDLKPTVCAGLSLGEYTALSASDRLPFEACLPLVQFRADAMNEACEVMRGTMAALFGLLADEVEQMVDALDMPDDLWIANMNSPGQVVISGTEKGVQAGIEAARARGAKRVKVLNVHGAFHSGLMKSAEEKMREKLREVPIEKSLIKFVMNVPGDYVTDTEAVRKNLIAQVISPVRWEKGIRAMIPHSQLFVEIGCGRTLFGINRSIGVDAPTLSVSTIEDLDHLMQLI